MSEHSYHDQVNKENIEKMRAVLQELPKFCKQFFRGIENTTSTRTRLGYALDLRIFFEFIQQNNNALRRTPIQEYPLSLLDQLGREDIEEYLDYLELYYKDDKEYRNDERGKSRKLASLRSMYHYFYTSELIEKDVAALVPMPKLHEKEIIRLDPDEVATLLELVENGEELTETEKRYHRVTKTRDLALLTLLLGTGIRVSECVGLDIEDVDFKNNGIKVTRKGGNEMVVYFGPEVEKALKNYLEVRKNIVPVEGHEHALFYSTQRKRIGLQAVENLVKKYARQVTTTKKITPHKLRSTYGTALYQETGDIYLVADVLGHKDVNTTKKHYAALDDSRRRQAATAVKLREE